MKKTYTAPVIGILSVRFENLIAGSPTMNVQSGEGTVESPDGAWTKRKEGCEWHFSTWGENEEL